MAIRDLELGQSVGSVFYFENQSWRGSGDRYSSLCGLRVFSLSTLRLIFYYNVQRTLFLKVKNVTVFANYIKKGSKFVPAALKKIYSQLNSRDFVAP